MNLSSVLRESIFEDTKVGYTEKKLTAFQVNQLDPLPFLSLRQLEGLLKEKRCPLSFHESLKLFELLKHYRIKNSQELLSSSFTHFTDTTNQWREDILVSG